LLADTGTEEFIQVLEMVGPKLNQKAVLFPCYDESVLLVSRFRQRLEKWYQVILPSPEIVEMLTDKIRFYTFAREKGLPVPRSFFLYCRADAAGGHMSTGRETGNWKNGGRGPHLLRAHQRGGVTPVAVAGFAQRADLECIGRGRPQTSKRDRRFHACHSFRPTFTTTGASLPGLSLASNTFGQVRNSLDPRVMQFAVKYVF